MSLIVHEIYGGTSMVHLSVLKCSSHTVCLNGMGPGKGQTRIVSVPSAMAGENQIEGF